jgi:phosphatidylglycerophosphatase A
MLNKFNLLFLTMFNIGKFKFAPGTVASLATCVFFFFMQDYFNFIILFFFTILVFFYSLVAINMYYKNFKSDDPQEIVVDEFVGQMLPLLAIPIYETLNPAPKILYCGAAFFMFRFFDILKPYPISYIDNNTSGAFGVMLDDIVAGIFATIILIVVFLILGG